MPLFVRIWGRLRGEHEIDSAYSLGKLGMVFNVVGIVYLLFAIVTFNFPSVYTVKADNFNYTSAACGVAILIAAITWFTTGKKNYTGPQRGGILQTLEGSDSSDRGPRSLEQVDVDGKTK